MRRISHLFHHHHNKENLTGDIYLFFQFPNQRRDKRSPRFSNDLRGANWQASVSGHPLLSVSWKDNILLPEDEHGQVTCNPSMSPEVAHTPLLHCTAESIQRHCSVPQTSLPPCNYHRRACWPGCGRRLTLPGMMNDESTCWGQLLWRIALIYRRLCMSEK